jgi:23S rRNA (cytidine1920-2'-O)/16S rRNA (cytidine1409-2'-O)-methyltransferase
VPSRKRVPFVALLTLLNRRFPQLDDPVRQIDQGLVLVNGAPATNPQAQVRRDAAIRLVRPRPLRGTVKLARALDTFEIGAAGLVALDLGAAAGGFTQALLDAGVARVYAVDAGVGQLRGWLRADPRVINLERTNLAHLDQRLLPDPVDLVTMDLSYLSVAAAVSQIDQRLLAPGAQLIALIKPTFELKAATLAAEPQQVSAAVTAATRAIARHGWKALDTRRSPIRGTRGAVEVLLYAVRATEPPPRRRPASSS